ncbi:MAG: 16S rRNA (guanine(527)-N(7))-methyltransferase RsmG, partial [Pseudomonadota bacterium]|nr:16S rRNA (guanine(527)-N(7))-methyltransferase RsmG [Pseudomonadota bacterium]
MTSALWQSQLRDGLAAMDLSLDEDRQEKQLAFLGLLNKWNRAY